MAMRINSNPTLGLQARMSRTSTAISNALARLGSGKRIQGPRENPADFAATVRLEAQVRGLKQISGSLNRAFGILQTADSAISVQMDIVQRMRELSVQAANGTLSSTDRSTLNDEVQALLTEFGRISTTTEFDDIKLLNGTFDTKKLKVGADINDYINLELNDLKKEEAFQKTVAREDFEPVVAQAGGADMEELITADLNGDSFLDLVTADAGDNTISVFLGNGDGSFKTRKTFSAGSGAYDVLSGDFNGDGILDLVTDDTADDTLSLFLGNGDGTFKARRTLGKDSTTSQEGFAAGDFDDDGNLDLVALGGTNDDADVFFGNGDGSFESAVSYDLGGASRELVARDVNGDEILDLIGLRSNGDFLDVLLGNEDGSFQAVTSVATGATGAPDGLDFADVDNDGDLDALFAANGDNGFYLLTNDGAGAFSGAATHGAAVALNDIAIGDFNKDGNIDVVGEAATAETQLYFGNGDGSFDASGTFLSGGGTGIVVGDFSGDSVLDVVSLDTGGADSINYLETRTREVTAVPDLNFDTAQEATDVIAILDNTLDTLTEERANISNLYTRLEQTAANNLTQEESVRSAKSTIEDADFAAETAELVRLQIIQQTQVAMMGQANVNQQVALTLLAQVPGL